MLNEDTYGAKGDRKSDDEETMQESTVLTGGSAPPDDFIMRPRVDVCFKRLMEDEEVRIGFLSAILDIPPEEIESVVLLPTGTLPEYGDDKLGILDFKLFDDEAYHPGSTCGKTLDVGYIQTNWKFTFWSFPR